MFGFAIPIIFLFVCLFMYNVLTFSNANSSELWSLKLVEQHHLIAMADSNPEGWINTSMYLFLFLEQELAGKKLFIPSGSPLRAEDLKRRSRLSDVEVVSEPFDIHEELLTQLVARRKVKKLTLLQEADFVYVYPEEGSSAAKSEPYAMVHGEAGYFLLPYSYLRLVRRSL